MGGGDFVGIFKDRMVDHRPINRIKVMIEELSKLEVDLPRRVKTPQNLRAIQSATGILKGLSLRV